MQIKSKHFGSFSLCEYSIEIAHGCDYQITISDPTYGLNCTILGQFL